MTRIVGVDEDRSLRVTVSAPPVEGNANAALERLLAAELRIPRSAVKIVRGAAARSKVVSVQGPTREELQARWPGLALGQDATGENHSGRR